MSGTAFVCTIVPFLVLLIPGIILLKGRGHKVVWDEGGPERPAGNRAVPVGFRGGCGIVLIVAAVIVPACVFGVFWYQHIHH